MVNSDGSYTFDPGGDFQDLALGETRVVSFVFEVEDNNGATSQNTVTITVTGVNDEPVVSTEPGDTLALSIAATGNPILASGTGTVRDLDASDQVTVAITGFSKSGTTLGLSRSDGELTAMLSVAPLAIASGQTQGLLSWTFDSAGYAFEYLGDSESVTLTYQFTVTDTQGASVTGELVLFLTWITLRLQSRSRGPIAIRQRLWRRTVD